MLSKNDILDNMDREARQLAAQNVPKNPNASTEERSVTIRVNTIVDESNGDVRLVTEQQLPSTVTVQHANGSITEIRQFPESLVKTLPRSLRRDT